MIRKCHFDDLFKKILEEIETEFDKDFELEVFYDLEGDTDQAIGLRIANYHRYIVSGLWDIQEGIKAEPETKTFIKDNIILLLYLYKKLMEEQ